MKKKSYIAFSSILLMRNAKLLHYLLNLFSIEFFFNLNFTDFFVRKYVYKFLASPKKIC